MIPCCLSLGPTAKTLDNFIIFHWTQSLPVYPPCFFIFPNALTRSIIVHPSFLLSIPGTHPSIALFFFFFFFTARRPVFVNDISIRNVLWSWLTHRWLEEIHFFSPAVPQLPIKNRLSLSNCTLSCGVILKLGDLDAVEQSATLATLAHNYEFVASDKSWLNAVPRKNMHHTTHGESWIPYWGALKLIRTTGHV